MRLINVPRKARRGEIIEIKTLLSHPMETGYRHDNMGNLIPRDIISRFVCVYNGMEVSIGVAGDWLVAASLAQLPHWNACGAIS